MTLTETESDVTVEPVPELNNTLQAWLEDVTSLWAAIDDLNVKLAERIAPEDHATVLKERDDALERAGELASSLAAYRGTEAALRLSVESLEQHLSEERLLREDTQQQLREALESAALAVRREEEAAAEKRRALDAATAEHERALGEASALYERMTAAAAAGHQHALAEAAEGYERTLSEKDRELTEQKNDYEQRLTDASAEFERRIQELSDGCERRLREKDEETEEKLRVRDEVAQELGRKIAELTAELHQERAQFEERARALVRVEHEQQVAESHQLGKDKGIAVATAYIDSAKEEGADLERASQLASKIVVVRERLNNDNDALAEVRSIIEGADRAEVEKEKRIALALERINDGDKKDSSRNFFSFSRKLEEASQK